MAERPLRIAVGTGTFPCLSETFVLRQICDLLDLGHDVRIFAERRPPTDQPVQPELVARNLTARTVYLDMPPATECELPVRPILARTWPPAAERPVRNARRLAEAGPRLLRVAVAAPRLTAEVLDRRRWDHRADSLSGLYRLTSLLRVRRPVDVAHVHFGPVADNVRFVRRLWRAPLVVSFHGYDFSSWPRQHGRDVYARLFEEVDAVTVGSGHARDRLIDLGCPEHLLHRLPVGLDLRSFRFAERLPGPGGEVHLLSIARLVPKKGIDGALRAVAALRADHPGLRYDVVGEGPERPHLEKLAGELGIADAVTFHGPATADEVRRHLEQAHLFVMPSTGASGDEEGQGLALQEAQACGLPVVATDHGPLGEGLVPGRSGVIVGADDPAALTMGLRALLEAPQRWPAMGRCGRDFVHSTYDSARLVERLLDIYRVAGERRRAAGG